MKTKNVSEQDAVVTLVLDSRRTKIKVKKLPVKIRIWDLTTQTSRLYKTKIDLTESEFEAVWLTQKKVAKKYQDLRHTLDEIYSKANRIIVSLDTFTFDAFKQQFYKPLGDKVNIIYSYNELIDEFKKTEQYGTASNYDLSLKSLKAFVKYKTNRECIKISFYDITPKWLSEYERYMINHLNRSETTVSMYLRTLRTVFNKAISDKIIHPDIYPFGSTAKKLYPIPTANTVKKALKKDELSTLFKVKPLTPEQAKARDFWFFSYSCNGMNIKDIAQLKFKDIHHNKFEYRRAKTINTKMKQKKNEVYLNDFINSIIDKYGKPDKHPNHFVFDIIDESQNILEQRRKIQAFTRFVNQHIQKLCKHYDLPIVSTYWARHTFASISIRQGQTMEFMQQLLGHGNIKTTQNYFDGFEDETLIAFSQNVMNF